MNKSEDMKRWRLLELSERALDGKLSAEETSQLEKMLEEPAMQTLFAQTLHQDAELRFDRSLVKELSETPAAPLIVSPWRNRLVIGLALAACVTFGLFSVFSSGRFAPAQAGEKTIATVIKASHCKWAGSTLPTAEGSRITAGTLELVEGMATVKFDSGAEVVMEAPATLELVDTMACRLVRGTLVADVPPSAIGFSVDTPDAKVVDFGTRFGVSAGENGKYLVKVLEGLVEVSPKSTGKAQALHAGQSVDNGLRRIQLNPQTNEQESNRWQPNVILEDRDGWQIVSTAYGRGKDTYIQNSKSKNFGRDPYFRVKKTTLAKELNRKGYFGFDVSKFDCSEINDAELVLSIEPSDLGFATLVPDSTFAVYGLTDESEDDWKENALTWHEAPAHNERQADSSTPDMRKAVLLGHFDVAQGISSGTRKIRGQALVDFLHRDSNGLVTFMICRETDETAKDGMVHAFATKESGNNTPPLLRVKQ